MTKNGHSATHVAPTTPSWAEAYATCRLQVAAVALGDGRSFINLINLYAHSGCGRAQERESFTRTVFEVAETLGSATVAIGGDWNAAPEDSDVVREALRTGRWRDAGAQAGKAHIPLFIGPRGCSRLDYWILNNPATQLVKAYKVLTRTAAPAHLPVILSVH